MYSLEALDFYPGSLLVDSAVRSFIQGPRIQTAPGKVSRGPKLHNVT